jgi:hypothetical protein
MRVKEVLFQPLAYLEQQYGIGSGETYNFNGTDFRVGSIQGRMVFYGLRGTRHPTEGTVWQPRVAHRYPGSQRQRVWSIIFTGKVLITSWFHNLP